MSVLALLMPPALSGHQAFVQPAALADARTALGGDASLNAVTSLVVAGALTKYIAPGGTPADVEFDYVLPAQYVRIERRVTSRGPLGSFTITDWHGLDGDTLINRTEAPGATIPVVIPGPQPQTQQEADALHARLLNNQRRAFARFALPLFATPFAVYPVTFTPSAASSSHEIAFDVAGTDGFTFQFALDATTHLPARISWMGRPIVTVTTSSMATISGRDGTVRSTPPTGIPAGDPTTGMPDVPWQLSIGDYRAERGLTWPHRLTTTVDGKPYEDIKISKYRINEKIDPKKFKAG